MILSNNTKVVYSPNKFEIGLEGVLVYEQNKKNGNVIIKTEKGFKMINKGILEVGNPSQLINISLRDHRRLKKIKRIVTIL